MRNLFILLDLTPQVSFTPLTAESIVNFISNNYLLIVLLIFGIIISAILCYFACSYLLMMWNHYMGIEDNLGALAEHDLSV